MKLTVSEFAKYLYIFVFSGLIILLVINHIFVRYDIE